MSNKLFLLLGLIVIVTALDSIKFGSNTPRHKHSSSQIQKGGERNFRPLNSNSANTKRDDNNEVNLIDAYLERATLCSNTTDYSVCFQGNATFAYGNKNYQHDLIYNPTNDEFFLVYIQQIGYQTSIVGQLLDDLGDPIGSSIGVVTYGDNSGPKHNPRVSYSPIDDMYFVVFEYLTVYQDGSSDPDIGGMFIAGNGTKLGEPFYVGSSEIAIGPDQNPRVTYNSAYDYFIVVHEHTEDGATHLILQAITYYGDNSEIYEFGSQYNDTNPDIAFNPATWYYYLVWTTTDPISSTVYGVQVDVTGLPFGDVAPIGDATFVNGTAINNHNPVLAFDTTDNDYLVIFEVDLEGSGTTTSNILGRPVDINGIPQDNYIELGGLDSNNGTYTRNPTVAYGSQNDEFVIAYEAFVYATGVSTIRTTVVSADDLTIKQDLLASNGITDAYYPSVAYDSSENAYLVMWNNGEVNTTSASSSSSTTGTSAMIDNEKTKSNTGAIVGGVFGALGGVAIIGGVAFLLRKRQKRKAYEMHSLNEN